MTASSPNFFYPIESNVSEFLEEILEERMDEYIDELVEEVEWAWRRIAASSSKLRSTKQVYLEAIRVERYNREIVLSLDNSLASAVEQGSQKFNLKPGFLGNRPYRVIPLVDAGTNNVTRFRTVSTGSSGWNHPGIKPANITEEVLNEVETQLSGEVFSRVLSRMKL